MTSPAPTPAVIQQYRELLEECQGLSAKISALEMDRNEHVLVEETLRPLDPKRRAYRLIGEVLVERTVEEVLPSVKLNRENMEKSIAMLRERMEERQKQAAEIKVKYNLQEAPAR